MAGNVRGIDGSPYELSALPNNQPGVTIYDDGFPVVGYPIQKGTDDDLGLNIAPNPYVEWSELDYEIGGEPGAVNRNAYVINGIPVTYDAHDFRGDHPVIPVDYHVGNYGDVGSSDDYATQYTLGVAAQGYPDITSEESWDVVSQGF